MTFNWRVICRLCSVTIIKAAPTITVRRDANIAKETLSTRHREYVSADSGAHNNLKHWYAAIELYCKQMFDSPIASEPTPTVTTAERTEMDFLSTRPEYAAKKALTRK